MSILFSLIASQQDIGQRPLLCWKGSDPTGIPAPPHVFGWSARRMTAIDCRCSAYRYSP